MESIEVSKQANIHGMSLGTIMRGRFLGGKVSVPVRNYTPFAHFKHVEGVPSSSESGYSISRLQVLDTLIERLVQLKKQDALAGVPADPEGLSEKTLDSIIHNLSKELRGAVENPVHEPVGLDFGMVTSQTGSVLSMLA